MGDIFENSVRHTKNLNSKSRNFFSGSAQCVLLFLVVRIIPRKRNINILTSETVPKLFFTLMVLLGGSAEELKHDQRSSGRCCLENSS